MWHFRYWVTKNFSGQYFYLCPRGVILLANILWSLNWLLFFLVLKTINYSGGVNDTPFPEVTSEANSIQRSRWQAFREKRNHFDGLFANFYKVLAYFLRQYLTSIKKQEWVGLYKRCPARFCTRHTLFKSSAYYGIEAISMGSIGNRTSVSQGGSLVAEPRATIFYAI